MRIGRVRDLVRAASRTRELRRRRPPRLAVAAGRSAPATAYLLAPDENTPSGGVRVIYRHVDLLNAAGLTAAVLHTRRGFRCDWFANSTRVVSARDVTLGRDDVLVVPEYYAPGLHLLPPQPRKIIFNQGAYHTFDHIPYPPPRPGGPYSAAPNVVAILTVSQDSAALLSYAFPAVPVHTARSVVDSRLFHPQVTPPGRRMAYMPRRRPQERAHLLHLLHAHGVLDGWELVAIDGRTEAQTAEMMRSSAIFLSFSEREGFGLPPAEAMASGCYVVGFAGQGGRDYFDPDYCTPVPDSDVLAFAEAVEDAVRRYDTEPESLRKAGQLASERVLGRYHEEGLREDLLALYGPLLDTGDSG